MSKRRRRFSGPSAKTDLERALMSTEIPAPAPEIPEPPRRSIYDGDAPQIVETMPDSGEEGHIDEAFREQILAQREEKSVKRAEHFQRLDTKVSIDDVKREQFARPTRPEKVPQIKLGTRDEVIKKRVAEWSNWIIDDANPLLLKATQAYCGIPEFWLDNRVLQAIDPQTNKALIFWDPPLRSRLELSEKKAKTLAKAAAEFSVSPMGVAITTWVEAHQFIIAVGAALVVAGQYGWTLMQTKAEVTQVKAIVEQQQLAQAQNQVANPITPNGAVRYPGFGEKTSEYDAEQNT
jgi:hypothetical protein